MVIEIYKNLNLQDLNGEIWKEIGDFEDYQMSNFGVNDRTVSNIKNGKSCWLRGAK